MSTHWLNVIVALVLAIVYLVPQPTIGQSDIFQITEKRGGGKTQNKYCGKKLSNALQLICDGIYNSAFKKSVQEMEMDDYPFAYDEPYLFRTRASANALMGRLSGGRYRRQASRGVHDECCLKPCTLDELTAYCGR